MGVVQQGSKWGAGAFRGRSAKGRAGEGWKLCALSPCRPQLKLLRWKLLPPSAFPCVRIPPLG